MLKIARRRTSFNQIVPLHKTDNFIGKITHPSTQNKKHILLGSGILTSLLPKNAIKKVINEVISGKASTAAKNLIALHDKYPNKTRLNPGEKHAPLNFGKGRIGWANYMGPGTKLLKRLNRGDKPRSFADKVSQRHDIDYSLSRDASDIRKADSRMLKSLARGKRENLDTKWNLNIGTAGIGTKKLLEDVDLLRKDAFLGRPMNQKILRDKRAELEMQGFGPGDVLKAKIIKALRRAKNKKKIKKGKGLGVAGGSLRLAGGKKSGGSLRLAGGSLKLAGGALRLSGQGVDNIVARFVPEIIKNLRKLGFAPTKIFDPLRLRRGLKIQDKRKFDLKKEIEKQKKQKGGAIPILAILAVVGASLALIPPGIKAAKAIIPVVKDIFDFSKKKLTGKGLSSLLAEDLIKNRPNGKFVRAICKLCRK